MSKLLEVIQTEKFDVMLQVLLKVWGKPDGVTVSEVVADGIDVDSSTLMYMAERGYITVDKTSQIIKWKPADGSRN